MDIDISCIYGGQFLSKKPKMKNKQFGYRLDKYLIVIKSYVNLRREMRLQSLSLNGWQKKSCVLLGGETGPHARPMHPDWIRSVRDQCQAAGVPFYFKQWGNFKPMKSKEYIENCCRDWIHFPDGSISVKIKNAGRLLDGREHNDLPWGVV